jgi:curved DNA-binding protein CbpA
MTQQAVPSSYYDVLEISSTAGEEEIKRSYRKLALRWHPDLNPSNPRLAELKLKAINEAYAHLRDKQTRFRYDMTLRQQAIRAKAARNDNKPLPTASDLVRQFWGWFVTGMQK